MTPPAPDSSGSVDLAERYGAPHALRATALVALVVVVAGLGLAWLAWVVLVHGRPMARSDLVSFDVVDQHAVDVRFTVVRRSAEVEASCLLRASAADHTIVGERDVAVGPGLPDRATLDRTIRTEREATSVQMVGCTTEEQNRRR
ncbi:MAG: DUF4307 domain-containing protein [Nocardioides sp.]